MIDLYTFTTPNGRKPAILLEELAMPYTIFNVDIGKGQQFEEAFTAISPNGKIPAIRDRDTGITVFESGAILIYLAEKVASDLLPAEQARRTRVMQWLMFQMASVGPMFGQLGHFRNYAPERLDYALARYQNESIRILNVLERQLESHAYVAGSYSIADIAIYPWVALMDTAYAELSFAGFPNLLGWIDRLQARPAVRKGMDVLRPGFVSDLGVLAAQSERGTG